MAGRFDGNGRLKIVTAGAASSDLVDDTTPQLGGDLDTNGNNIFIKDGDGIVVGHGSQLLLGEVTAETQVIGTTETDGSVVVLLASETDALAPILKLVKNANAAVGTFTTAVADDEELGKIQAYGTDGTDAGTLAAEIAFNVDDSGVGAGTIGGEIILATATEAGALTPAITISNSQLITVSSNIVPDTDSTDTLGTQPLAWDQLFADDIMHTGANDTGRIDMANDGFIAIFWEGTDVEPVLIRAELQVSPGGSSRFIIDSSSVSVLTGADFFVANGTVFGGNSQIVAGEVTSEFQVLGSSETDSSMMLMLASTTDALSPQIKFVKNAQATFGTFTTSVADNEELGKVQAYGTDGSDADTLVAEVGFFVDDASITGGQIGGEIILSTATSGGTLTSRLTLGSFGAATFATGSTPLVVAGATGTAHPGSITSTGGLGGSTSISSTGTGGVGAGYSLVAGAGGVAASATTASTGGAGGAFEVTTGVGGVGTVTGSGTETGGDGGLLALLTGNGGAVTTGTGTNLGGDSGAILMVTGAGGASQDGTDTGGDSGSISITTGVGGNADTGGASGSISLTIGDVGSGGSPASGTINLVGDTVFSSAMSATPQAVTATSTGVVVALTSTIVHITTNGDSDEDALTLADGVDGQIIMFAVISVGNAADSVKITPASMIGGTKITFPASPLGLGCIMQYDAGADGWTVVGNNGGVIA